MKRNKGFTLIELLVVIAIIGILASVVLASLNNARSKGNDSTVKGNLRNILNQGEIVYNTRTANRDSYTNVCTNGLVDGVNGVGSGVLAAAKASKLASYSINPTTPGGTGTTATCNDSSSAWAAEVPLNGSTNGSPKMWCVDSLGKSKQTTSSIGLTTVCP